MVAEVVWLEQAKDDLRQILDFIAAENSSAADKYVAELRLSCERLTQFPLSGRRYNDEFRVLTFRNHLVFYWYDDATKIVSIAMVIDGRRDLYKLFDNKPTK